MVLNRTQFRKYKRILIRFMLHSFRRLPTMIPHYSSTAQGRRMAALTLRAGPASVDPITPPPKNRVEFVARRPFSWTTYWFASMSTNEIKKELERCGINTAVLLKKKDLVKVFLEKANSEELVSGRTSNEESSSTASTFSTSDSSKFNDDKRPQWLEEEIANCQAMKLGELKKELEERGVSTSSFFEKSEFVQALAEARVGGNARKSEEFVGQAEKVDAEVIMHDLLHEKHKHQQQEQQKSNLFGGAAGGNPFGGGMGGTEDIAELAKKLAEPGSPIYAKAQELIQNPKVLEIMTKAQSNPELLKKFYECAKKPAAFVKYINDPDVAELISELRKHIM